jgi:2-polyprenyl-6-methoxyphenol hydroxylase-like FAD-dependent oxidoreductase
MFGRRSTTEALVVGAGPVGLFAALQLKRQGVDVEIIDSQWRTAARSYALALHPQSLELFDELALTGPLLEHGRKVESIGFYDSRGREAAIDLGSLSGRFPHALVLPQSLLEAKLEEELEAVGVKVKWNHRLAGLELGDGSVEATIQRLGKDSTGYSVSSTEWVVEKVLTVEADFVFGADGCSSAVRRLAGISFEDLGRSQQFAVFECGTDRDAGNETRVVLEDQETSVYWPLSGDRFRWSFGLSGIDTPAERVKHRLAVQIGEQTLPYLSPESLAELLAERAPWFDAPAGEVFWSVGVQFDSRLAAEFGCGRVTLLGDAAHMAGPVGVQSMNVGFAEATELAALVKAIIQNGSSRDALDTYDGERLSEWRRLLAVDGSPVASDGASDWIRQRASRIPACIPASGEMLGQALGQLGLRLG